MAALFNPRHAPIGTDRQHHNVSADRLRAMSVSPELAYERCVCTNIRTSNAPKHAYPSVENPANVSWIVTDSRVVLIYPSNPHKSRDRFYLEYRPGWFHLWLDTDRSPTFVIEQFTRLQDETPQQSVARALERHYLPLMRQVPLRYKPLPSAPIGQVDLAHESWISPGNVLGMQGDDRRLDVRGGGTRWWQMMGRHSVQHGCQGHIFWRFRAHMQGCMYRPDVLRDYLYVRDGVREVMSFAKEADQWVGCTIRPGRMVEPSAVQPAEDMLRDSKDDGGDIEYHVNQLLSLRRHGFKHFYVDEPVSVEMLQSLRGAVGEHCNLFLESGTLQTLPYGGLYHEPGAATPHNPEWFVWLARLIYPNIPIAFKPRKHKTDATGCSELVEDWQWPTMPPRKSEAAGEVRK